MRTMVQRRDEDAAMFRSMKPAPVPAMEYTGALRIYFNRLSAEPMMWCVSPEDGMWEIAVSRVTFEGGAGVTTVYQPKSTPDDEDGRPSAWLAAHGRLRVFSDGTAIVTAD